MNQDVGDSMRCPRPHLNRDLRVILVKFVIDRFVQKIEQVRGIVIFTVELSRLPVIEQVPNLFANPLRPIGITLLGVAFPFFVVMTLIGCARKRPQSRYKNVLHVVMVKRHFQNILSDCLP